VLSVTPTTRYDTGDLAKALFEEAGDALFLLDPDTDQVIDANPTAVRLTGFPRSELLRMNSGYLLRQEVKGGRERLKHSLQNTTEFHGLDGYLLRTRDEGAWVPVNLTVARLHVRPRALGLITARDVRDQRAARAQTERLGDRLHRVLASLPDAVWSAEVGPDGRWRDTFLSPVVEKLAGRPAEYFLPDFVNWFEAVHPDDRARVGLAYEDLRAPGRPGLEIEYRVVRPDGSVCWLRDCVRASRDAAGRLAHLDGVLTDITERRKAEQSLRESELRLSRIVETSTSGIVLLLPDGRITFANSTAVQTLGYTREQLCRMNYRDLPWVDPAGGTSLRPSKASSSLYGQERVIQPPDGRRVILLVNTALMRDPQGAVAGVVMSFNDITVRKQAEEELRASQDRLARVFATAADGIMIVGPDERIAFANPAAERILGRPETELVGMVWNDPLFRVRGPDGREVPPADHISGRVFLRGEEALGRERLIARPDGSDVALRVSAAPLRDASERVIGMVASLTDITDRRRAEEALRASEEQYRLLAESMDDVVGLFTLEGRATYLSPSVQRSLGYAPEELTGGRMVELFHPDDVSQIAAREAARPPGGGIEFQARARRKDGTYVWLSIRAKKLLGDDGRPYCVLAVARDISERKQAREELTRQHALLRGLFNSIPDLIFHKDNAGTYRGANEAFAAYVGLSEPELVGKTDDDLFPPDRAAARAVLDRQVFEAGKPLHRESWIDYPDGRRALVETVQTPLLDDDGRVLGLIGVSRDLTHRHRLEEQLRQSQKMEAVGQLAGGIAHDFNNILTAILGNLGLALDQLPPHAPGRELLQQSETAAHRAALLTNQMLGFARRAPTRPEAVDLNLVIRDTVGLIRRTFDPRIVIRFDPEAELWPVWADPGQMHQILMNLCLNARDAMPAGGRLSVRVENLTLDGSAATAYLHARPGDFVRLAVADTGAGIPAELRGRVFEPFFTTKPVGQGTGLGLAMVFGIVQNHRGWIEFASEVGCGTRFDVYLPRSDGTGPAEAPAGEAPAVRGGGETVLLVDDEPMIRTLGETLLTSNGYRVLLAGDGEQGVELFRTRHADIDLVILDLTMPRMNGRDALKQLLAIDPSVRVLLSSGYSAEQGGSETPGVVGFLHKPYRPRDMARVVREALDPR
jgi:PAS domain S-box-containing protein